MAGEDDRLQSKKDTPNHQQNVCESSQGPPFPPSAFSEAFSFIKSSEFYSPPPPPVNSFLRQVTRSDASTSTSTMNSSSPYPSAQSRNAILVSHRQKGNPLLKHIRNIRWMFADVVCDYLLGHSSCALYLSLRYHLLHPDYLYFRIRELQKNFKLRVVLCHVDVEDVIKPLLEVTRTALLHDCTLLCGWSLEECGRYLETIKVYENKPADSIQERMDNDYMSRLTHALTSIRHVNKTDVITLGSTFGSLSRIMDASMEDLARCPGIGERKVKRLYDTFHEPFRRVASKLAKPVTIHETSVQGKAETAITVDNGSAGAEEKEVVAATEHKKEHEATVKSALAAAYAKHSEKISKQKATRSSRQKVADDAGSANVALLETETDASCSFEKD